MTGAREALAPLLAEPTAAAVLCDLDGTLAPIVARPELVEVPERTRLALERIADRFGLCAVVTGRRPDEARRIVGIDGIAYAGNHGFEHLATGADEVVAAPELAGRETVAMDFHAEAKGRRSLESLGDRVEDKGPIVGLHWRGVDDEQAAEGAVAELASEARERGLFTHPGRKVLELRPPVAIDKGIAVAGLVRRAGVRTALFAGDDRTDLDGFAALAELRDRGGLDAIVRVGVSSPEGPPEVVETAEVVVAGTEELVDLLEILAEG